MISTHGLHEMLDDDVRGVGKVLPQTGFPIIAIVGMDDFEKSLMSRVWQMMEIHDSGDRYAERRD